MLSICIRPPAKGAACLGAFKGNTLSHFPKMVCSHSRPSKLGSFMVQKSGCGIIKFTNEGCKPHPSVQNSDVEIEAMDEEIEGDGDLDGDGPWRRFRERGDEKDYDKDPEVAEILGSCLDDPDKARSKVEERLRKKRNRIVQTKTGSGTPMKVTFNNFDYSNSYIWFEFDHPPLQKDVSLICDMIRSWHIIGRLGGCNSLNMQLSQSPSDKRPSYDAIQGANVEPATFYNIGDMEIQDNLARIWVDIGTSEPLLLDVLLNGLTQISSDFVGIKQVVFGGSEFENWKETVTTEDAGYSVHKI
ncbi:hypothetical protein RND81_14G182200 [Saponaria officinalis]|uniref:Uncharacterized protein n=1 Tax=Saponaria officinalis TaxID=3572 RepID=A0AAW1GPI5_SAPOF